MLAFVTVGSTRFDSLVNRVLSTPVLSSLRNQGYSELVVQCGNSDFDYAHLLQHQTSCDIDKDGVSIQLWRFKPSLQDEYERARLVISHAGSGTILDVLRMKKPLIVVPNPTLLDNHQEELASALEDMGYLRSSTPSSLDTTIQTFDPSSIQSFPQLEGSRFRNILDEEMGFEMGPRVTKTLVSEVPQIYENLHVHEVYDKIASHFSATRYKPWPIIAKFLSDLPQGSIGLDSGTGNGKYLPLPEENPGSVLTIGLDRSLNLLKIAKHAGVNGVVREVVRGDVLEIPWRLGVFDYAISIATIHHLATRSRRKIAVQRLLQSVSPTHGRVLIYVWAIEQDEFSKREIPVDDVAGDSGQDVFVPWNLNRPNVTPNDEPQTYNRYYHMFAKGELTTLVTEAAQDLGWYVGPKKTNYENVQGMHIIQDGWERSNYYIELRCWKA
ncbi:hypothetical protein D9758_003248 [Tetrapyrgos nigripes]|uniref:UDP-N-acetylglucosamine transferase subunit ALG13 n=1 Tax=Tetrapyrgos nigripes TaxID=182062 RepID=A0A8H5GIN0_9AGAR|nr:hypothetical protein D9758_003248 [Tetrapyrgos nigripes]